MEELWAAAPWCWVSWETFRRQGRQGRWGQNGNQISTCVPALIYVRNVRVVFRETGTCPQGAHRFPLGDFASGNGNQGVLEQEVALIGVY